MDAPRAVLPDVTQMLNSTCCLIEPHRTHAEIIRPGPVVKEGSMARGVRLYSRYYDSTCHKLSRISYFKTNESGLKISRPFDIGLRW